MSTKDSQEKREIQPKGHRKGSVALSSWTFVVLIIVLISFIALPIVPVGNRGQRVVFGSYKGTNIVYSSTNSVFTNQVQNQTTNLDNNANPAQIRSAWRDAFDLTAYLYIIENLLMESGYYFEQSQLDRYILENFFTVEGKVNQQQISRTDQATIRYLNTAAELSLYQEKWNAIAAELFAEESESLSSLLVTSPIDLRKFGIIYYQLSDYPAEEVEKFFISNKEEFASVKLKRLTVSSEEADELQNRIDAAEMTFAELAKEYSTDFYRDSGGDMGSRSYRSLKNLISNKEVLDELFSSAAGTIVTMD